MATQTVEFPCVTGQTVTAKLFSFGSDTEVASVSATEATNRKGLYSAAFTDVAAGTYRLIALNGSSVPLAAWDVTLTLTTATFQAYDIGMTIPLVQANAIQIAGIAAAIGTATVSTGSTTTSVTTSACSPAGAAVDQFKGRVIIFGNSTTTAALRGAAALITASTNSSTPTFTLASALPASPVSGDTFVIA